MLLGKGVYPYKYMDGWDKVNETSIPSTKSFYSNLTMENINETDYRHANNVFKIFKLNNWVIIMIYTFKVTHFYLQMSLRILEKLVLKVMN